MEIFILFSFLITLAALFSYINIRTLNMPSGIALMLMGTFAALIVIFAGGISPVFSMMVKEKLGLINFTEFLLGILLSFLLFAGSLHVRFIDLKKQATAIFGYAILGTLLSTCLTGIILYYLLSLFSVHVPILYCFIFGALISPTDPVAVMSILGKSNLPKPIQTTIIGESLFNDGIGVVIFATLIHVSFQGIDNTSIWSVLKLFLIEAVGGVAAGFCIGYMGYKLMKRIDHFQTEILLSLAMVMGGYSLCHYLHVSGPLAMVVTGLLTGNIGRKNAMSDITRDHLEKFWLIIDEILNAILFMLIGLEIVTIQFGQPFLVIGITLACLLLLIRYLSLWLPATLLFLKKDLNPGSLQIMSWGGLRGGISIALVLSLPVNEYKTILVSITFIIVLFSVLIQGLTIGRFIKHYKLN